MTALRIIFDGTIDKEATVENVKTRFMELFHRQPDQIEKLFDGKKHTLKRVASLPEAQRYLRIIHTTGAIARVLDETGNDITPPRIEPKPTLARAKPIQRRWLYLATLPLVTLATLVTGLTYAALVLGWLGLTLFWAISPGWLYEAIPYSILALLAHALPLVLFALIALFLLKPLIGARPKQSSVVRREDAPDLYDFVDHVFAMNRAPTAAQIVLDHSAEVEVELFGGLKGLFDPKLKVTIGLPLLAGADTSQLAGLLAHDGAYFRRQFGLRQHWFIRSLTGRLVSAAHFPDRLDNQLARWSPTSPLLQRTRERLRTWLPVSKKIPALFLAIVSPTVQRHLATLRYRVDADAVEVCGVDNFRKGLEASRLIAYTRKHLGEKIQEWHEKGWFADDMATVAAGLQDAMQEARKVQVLNIHNRTQQQLSPLPSDKERLAAIATLEHDGDPLVSCSQPARLLLPDFAGIDRHMSLALLRNDFDIPATPDRLLPFKYLKEPLAPKNREQKTVHNYFGDIFTPDLQMKPISDPDWDEAKYITIAWKEAVLGMSRLGQRGKAAIQQYRQAELDRQYAYQGVLLHEAGLDLPPSALAIEAKNLDQVHELCREAEGEREQAVGVLMPYSNRVIKRLSAALALFQLDESVPHIPHCRKLAAEAGRLLAAQNRLATIAPHLHHLQEHIYALELLLSLNRGKEKLRNERIDQELADLNQWISAIEVALKSVGMPIGLEGRDLPIITWAERGAPQRDDVESRLRLAGQLHQRLRELQYSVLSRMVGLAIKAERAWRLVNRESHAS